MNRRHFIKSGAIGLAAIPCLGFIDLNTYNLQYENFLLTKNRIQYKNIECDNLAIKLRKPLKFSEFYELWFYRELSLEDVDKTVWRLAVSPTRLKFFKPIDEPIHYYIDLGVGRNYLPPKAAKGLLYLNSGEAKFTKV